VWFVHLPVFIDIAYPLYLLFRSQPLFWAFLMVSTFSISFTMLFVPLGFFYLYWAQYRETETLDPGLTPLPS
jgi:hypothetical protein